MTVRPHDTVNPYSNRFRIGKLLSLLNHSNPFPVDTPTAIPLVHDAILFEQLRIFLYVTSRPRFYVYLQLPKSITRCFVC